MKKSRIVTALFVVGSASFGFLPLAHAAATQTQQVTPSAEAWYQPNPTCGLPVGCVGTGSLPAQPPVQPPVAVPMTPYPAGSMHVAVSAGQETARSYLSFSLPLFDSTLTAASIDIPLDTAQADGSVTPDQSHVAICTFQGSVTPASGSIDQPPTASCGSTVSATYVATPQPHLHADLAPLVSALSSGAGLVLLPDAKQTTQSSAWHVVFSAHDRTDSAKTPPASMTATLTPVAQPSFDDGSSNAVTPPVTNAPPPALGPVSVPPATTNLPQAPTVGNPQPQVPQVQQVPQARTITVGYAYPTVWLLPLAFLFLIPLVARALTRDLTPVRLTEA